MSFISAAFLTVSCCPGAPAPDEAEAEFEEAANDPSVQKEKNEKNQLCIAVRGCKKYIMHNGTTKTFTNCNFLKKYVPCTL